MLITNALYTGQIIFSIHRKRTVNNCIKTLCKQGSYKNVLHFHLSSSSYEQKAFDKQLSQKFLCKKDISLN